MKKPCIPSPSIVMLVVTVVLWAASVRARAESASTLVHNQTYTGELERNVATTIQNYEETCFEALANILLIEVVSSVFVALALIILCCRDTVLEARARAGPKPLPNRLTPSLARSLTVTDAAPRGAPTEVHSFWSRLRRSLVVTVSHFPLAIFLASSSRAQAE